MATVIPVPPGAGLTERTVGAPAATTVKPDASVPAERSRLRTLALRVPGEIEPASEIVAVAWLQESVVVERMLISPGITSAAPVSKPAPETVTVRACPGSAVEGVTWVTWGVGRPTISFE